MDRFKYSQEVLAPSAAEIKQERRVNKFEGLFTDQECIVAALELIGERDTAAKEIAARLSEWIEESRSTIKASA